MANTNTCSVDSRVNQSTGSIPFGRAVSRSNQTGAPDNGIEVYEGARFEGIAIMDERVPASSGVAFATGDIVPVLWHGDVAVKVSAAVTNNSDVVIATAESGAGATFEEIGQLSTKAANSYPHCADRGVVPDDHGRAGYRRRPYRQRNPGLTITGGT